jgi:hypothetical protein
MKIEQLLQAVSESKLDELNLAPGSMTYPGQTTAEPQGDANATGTTGDATLNQPLPAGAPKKPGTTFAQKVGGLAKGVGAVAGGVAGIGRAVKKGYAAGANAVGGPGAPTTSAPTLPAPGASTAAADQADELAQLRSQLQIMQQFRAG